MYYCSMNKEFGVIKDGRTATLYTLDNKHGMKVSVTDYGATIVSIFVTDRDGLERDVVLGYDDAASYEKGECFFGAVVGRYANRISEAGFELNGTKYNLTANDRANTLHGGRDFYGHRLWDTCEYDENSITFGLHSPDADQGFPGDIDIRVTYLLSEQNELEITYSITESRRHAHAQEQDALPRLLSHTFIR